MKIISQSLAIILSLGLTGASVSYGANEVVAPLAPDQSYAPLGERTIGELKATNQQLNTDSSAQAVVIAANLTHSTSNSFAALALGPDSNNASDDVLIKNLPEKSPSKLNLVFGFSLITLGAAGSINAGLSKTLTTRDRLEHFGIFGALGAVGTRLIHRYYSKPKNTQK